MEYILDAACLCNTGKVRKNNEDNFFFDGMCLEEDNNGLTHPLTMTKPLCKALYVAIYDGMGGENFGECASYSAAAFMKNRARRLKDCFISARSFLNELCMEINAAVVAREQELRTEYMGTTMVALYFSHGYAYTCNLGDSRAYCLRDGKLLQLSVDHVEKREVENRRKAPLTQHLGIDPEYFLIEPYIVSSRLKQGDQYLLCSDGLTDMLADSEIGEIMTGAASAEDCVQKLVDSALEKGGRDNVTVILCRIL